MPNNTEILNVGKELAALIETLPKDERDRYRRGIGGLVHDLRQTIGIIFTAEQLLRESPRPISQDAELLDAINNANKRAMSILTDFAKPFDTGITLPITTPPNNSGK